MAIDVALPPQPSRIAAKYELERKKRIRKGGEADQYTSVEGECRKFGHDPWIMEKDDRPPIQRSCEILILGGGFSGQVMAVTMLKSGFNDILMVEKGDDFGGTSTKVLDK
ncbi:hypothetical protein KEM56_002341, partial [Ascosphaera pollenicola]